MPGKPGNISFSGPRNSMYLGNTIGIFREGDYMKLTRIGQSNVHLGVKRDGTITNGQMLFSLLDDLWQNEAAVTNSSR